MFVGQSRIKSILDKSIETSKKLNVAASHILLNGKPGLGKTTLAYYIAKELGTKFHHLIGPKINFRSLCVLAIKLEEKDIVFIDEIHALPLEVEEFLYPVVEEFKLIYKNQCVPIKPFTLIGATTNIGKISKPLLDRFVYSLTMDNYSEEDLIKISRQKAEKLNITLEDSAHKMIAASCKETPRLIHNLMQATRDHVVSQKKTGTEEDILQVLDSLDIKDGLSKLDRDYLALMSSSPVGLSQLSSILGVDQNVLENHVEPYLIEKGMVIKTPKGRRKKQNGTTIDTHLDGFMKGLFD